MVLFISLCFTLDCNLCLCATAMIWSYHSAQSPLFFEKSAFQMTTPPSKPHWNQLSRPAWQGHYGVKGCCLTHGNLSIILELLSIFTKLTTAETSQLQWQTRGSLVIVAGYHLKGLPVTLIHPLHLPDVRERMRWETYLTTFKRVLWPVMVESWQALSYFFHGLWSTRVTLQYT